MKLPHSGAVDFACNAPLRKSCRLSEPLGLEKALVATGVVFLMSLQTAFPARVYLQTRSVVVSTSWRLFIVNDGQALVLVSSSSSYAGRETQPNPVSLSQKAVELHIVAALAR